jgi:hypothetical protein
MKALGCGGLLDCCLRPQRAYRAGLGSAYLEWAGDRLGPGRVAQIQREEGIKRLLGLITSGESVMLLYDRELPGECVRHHLVIRVALRAEGRYGSVESRQATPADRLLRKLRFC